MRVICDRGTLVDALGLMGSVAVQRTPKPVLSCVKIVAGDDGLTLTATDLEVSLTLNALRVEVEQPGEALVPADKLNAIVRESIDPTLTLATEGEVVQITGQDSKYRIYSQAVSDFPSVPAFGDEPHFEMVAGDLHRLVAMTIFATARENSRYAINGVLMERDGKQLTVVATDGHRLALAKGKAQAAADGGQSAIVPTKALQLLLRLFDDAEQVVKIALAGNRVLFSADHATLTSSLVEGNFPPYRDVIPKDGDRRAMLMTDVFISAVRRAALLTNEESKGVRMAYSPDGLTLSSRAPEMGEAEINVELAGYEGESIEIGFNPAYLLDALKVMDDKQVQFDFKAPNKPGVLRTGPDFLYVVMPVNLQ
ncbi:MAG: DNA polymerase III subunit beta [Planctomycetota bacterium]